MRYATSTRELTRATKSYTETLSIPSGGVVDGQTFTLTLNIDNLPLQDANGDAVLSSADITVTVPGRGAADTPRITGLGGTAILANQANGLASGDTITLVHTGSALSAGTQINVAYLGLEDLLTVKGAPADTVPLRLRETGADTGVYQATIIATNGSFGEPNSPNGHLDPTLDPTNIATADANGVALGNTKGFALISVIDNGFVTVTYKDRSPVTTITARVRVEDDGPVFSNVSPADGATTGNTNELLVAGVTDLVAGVDPTTGTSVNVIFGTSIEGIIASGGNLVGSLANIFVTGGGPSSIISETFVSSGVYRISYSIANAPVVAAAVEAGTEISQLGVAWQVSVKDVAGNEARSSARNLIVDTTTPVLQGAFAGDNWDATNNRLASSDPSRKFGADSRTSIRVEFDKAMDGSSFDTGDFLVDGVAPTGVDHFAGSAVNVFLTVAEMAPDATPFIQIVGVVRDDGGNPLSTGSVTADDDMAPRVTLTFDDGRNATTGDIKLRIVSDEALATAIPFYRYQAMCVKHNVYGCHQPHSYRQGRPEPAGVDLRPEGHHHRSAQHARAGHRRT